MARGFIDGEYQDGDLRGLTGLFGQRGMGKTTETVRLVSQCSGGAIFYDTLDKHGHVLKGWVTFQQPGPLKDYLRTNRKRRFRVRYAPPRPNVFADKRDSAQAGEAQHLIAVCQIVAVFGDMIFAVDEIDRFCDKNGEMPAALYALAHYGRHYRVSMLCTARDPATLGINFRSQCEFLRIFRTDEDRYVQYFAGRIGKANAQRLRSLPQYHYLLWQSGTSEARVCGGKRAL